jgi:HK97 family phage prohead protease
MESVARGAFERSMRERRDQIRVLFQHGQDPFVGDKPLGPIRKLREDRQGAYYEVPLLNASYVADIAAGVEEGLYGASFRFRVMRDEFVENPATSDRNPDRLPERTLSTGLRILARRRLVFPPVPRVQPRQRPESLEGDAADRGRRPHSGVRRPDPAAVASPQVGDRP